VEGCGVNSQLVCLWNELLVTKMSVMKESNV
jgi:hypothetical protein